MLALALVISASFLGVTAAADDAVTRTDGNISVDESVVESDRPDPSTDRLGWEHGVWANATLSIDQSDGVNRTELQAVVARTMARVEVVREIEFDRTPAVRVIFQQQKREETGARKYTETERRLLNAQYESLFLINESRDAVESRRVLVGSGVNGYYSPETRNVTMISPNSSVRQIREGVLAQELFHAQQDNQFDLPAVGTIEERNTRNGYVEGDANYVQRLYEQRCTGLWNGTCYQPERRTTPDLSGLNEGMLRLFQQPYQSGYAFVRDRHQQQGWEAVNALYDRPPASSEQIIHPKAYGKDEPTNVTVTDRSTDAWHPLRVDGERVTGSVGEAGLYVSMVSPAVQTNGQKEIIPRESHLVGGFGEPVQLGYDHPVTAGWDGDRLVPYVAADGNETGYVYEIVWDSASDAREFHRAYRQLLAYHGAESVDGRASTYRVPEDSGFTDGFSIERDGTRLRIVNAPTVEALTSISRDAAPPANESRPVVPWQRVDRTWQTELGDRQADSLVVADGRIHLVGFDGTVQAVDLTTGELAWSRALNETITAEPAVSNGTVYVGTAASNVVALEAETGRVQWQGGINGSIVASPTVAKGTVYVGTAESTVAALDATTGERRWVQSAGGPIGTSLATTDADVYAASRAGLSAFDRSSGEIAWNMTLKGPAITAPVVAGETIYITSLDVESGASRVHALAAADGDNRWTRTINGTAGSVLMVAEDTVYAGGGGLRTSSGTLAAFDRQNGTQRWRLALNGSIRVQPAVSNGTVYVASAAGRVTAVEATSGNRQFRRDIDGAVTTPIVASNETLYVGGGGLLDALNGSTGDRQWTFLADGLSKTTPLVTDDGVFVMAGSTLSGLKPRVTRNDTGDGERSNGSPEAEDDSDEQPTQAPPTQNDPDPGTTPPTAQTGTTPTTTEGPGFGIAAVIGALTLVALALVSKHDEKGPRR